MVRKIWMRECENQSVLHFVFYLFIYFLDIYINVNQNNHITRTESLINMKQNWCWKGQFISFYYMPKALLTSAQFCLLLSTLYIALQVVGNTKYYCTPMRVERVSQSAIVFFFLFKNHQANARLICTHLSTLFLIFNDLNNDKRNLNFTKFWKHLINGKIFSK